MAALIAAILPLAGCGAATSQTRSATTTAASSTQTDAPAIAARAAGSSAATAAARFARRIPVPTTAAAPADLADGVSVWLPYWEMPSALDSALANSSLVRTASPVWYAIAGDSAIEENRGAGDRSVIGALRGHGVRVMPMVTEGEDLRNFDRTLASARRRAAMVHALLAIATSRAYSGLDLDFEEFALDRGHETALADDVASRYPAFVAEVCTALHAIGRTCAVTVMPRTTGAHVYWRNELATWVYDYGALARAADRVQIMSYDEHGPGTAAGPIAPYAWVKRIVAYAGSAMPLAKVQLALPAYGYDWSGGEAAAITSRQAPRLATANGVSPSWNAGQAEDTFRYTAGGRRHTVWYEGARAESERAVLAKQVGFAGIDLWAAGGEERATWPMLRALFATHG
jgi:spore germination protein YaaH